MNAGRPDLELLAAAGPAVDHRAELMRFGRFVGSWSVEASFWDEGGIEQHTSAEWHWGWILSGTALQDVLVFPARSSTVDPSEYRYGTSLRIFDVASDLWRVVWIAPGSGTTFKLSGRFAADGSIVLVGDPHDGEPTRWTFTRVEDDSFLWEGRVRDSPANEWRLIQRMTATRA